MLGFKVKQRIILNKEKNTIQEVGQGEPENL